MKTARVRRVEMEESRLSEQESFLDDDELVKSHNPLRYVLEQGLVRTSAPKGAEKLKRS
jgi:hypothetical protein